MNVHWQPARQGIHFRHTSPKGDVTQTCDTRGPDGFWCSLATGHEGWHVAQGEHVYDVWPRETFVPVPDGVTYEDALRAVEDARPWVQWDERNEYPEGARLRHEWISGPKYDPGRTLVHPDDVPDPDADLIERIAKAIYESDGGLDWSETGVRDVYLSNARAALAVIREENDR